MLREAVDGVVDGAAVNGLLVLSRRFRFVGGGLMGSLLMLILVFVAEVYTDTDFAWYEWLLR